MAINPYSSYTSMQVETATPAEQISSLFIKASEHMKEAASSIQKNDIFERYESSQKAITILEGLMSSLNKDTPERQKIAKDLELYYKTMINLISRVNIYNDLNVCNSLVQGFEDMAKFWKEAGKELEKQSENLTVPQEANLKA